MRRDGDQTRGTWFPCPWACGVCAAVCPSGAIDVIPGSLIRDPARCTRCGDCVRACPCGVLKEDRFARL